jgi:2-keto-3-deoxy-galactonokinase
MTASAPALIAIDWGSSSFRAYLTARDGAVVDEIASADGVSTAAPGAFAETLRGLVGGWLDAHADLPIVASGMVGSRHGWRETPYVKCPADPRDIAASLVAVQAGNRIVHLAPGLAYEDENGEPDVMRGEEVEILGISDSGGRLIVLPGSHSKWAIVERGRVERFKTFVTGELFAAIKDHTLAGAFARAAKGAAVRARVCARRRARRSGCARGRRVRPPWRPIRRPQPAADGQARRGGRGRISLRSSRRRGDRRGAAALSARSATCRRSGGAGEALFGRVRSPGRRGSPSGSPRAAARGLFILARNAGLF